MLTLYYAPMTCALVPFVTLTEAGAAFDIANVNSRTGQLRTPEFLRLNPKHKVPVLMIDGDPLTENIAIQIWIARQSDFADGMVRIVDTPAFDAKRAA
jgi:glutathione S-transferase